MEAVPRLPMLSCELKISPSNTEFGSSLKKYIQEFYHEDPEAYNKEIKELEALRQSASKVPRDFTGCRILKRYYAQLQSLQSRFPMSEDGAASVPFMWSDIYSGITFNITDIRYEQACVLYNIGALHSELGATDGRSNAEGMKVSCTHFQCGAWAFQHLRETYPQPKGSDMSHDLLTFFITLMLAQAQECILEKSMLDSRKSTITAKLAAQVVDYYKSAVATLVSGSASVETGCILEIIGSKLFKHWKKFLEFKMLYYGCLSHLYMGNQAEEQQQMGERVSWYQSAMDKHTEAVKLAKTMDRDDITEALTFTLDVIGGKYNAAKKENDFVYHEKVQPAETLPEIKGASLVKGIPFSTSDPDISGPDIFVRLVPIEAHESASVYSEEKAKLLRLVAAKIEDKDQELVTYLASLKLDRNILMPKEEKIPQELLEKCAAMSVKTDAIYDLNTALNALAGVYEEVNAALKEAQELLTREEEGEKLHQDTFEKRAPSLIILELNKEFAKYQEAHRRASESNSTLQKALTLHLANLMLLSGPLEELQKALPSINLMDTPNDESVARELQQLLDKVEEMRKQRSMLESQLRESIQNDDITKQLVTRDKKENIQKLFEEELKKHDALVGYLDQNLNAQDNILRALTQANARYADTRKAVAETTQRRELQVASLLNSYAAYEDIMGKAQKGLEFYRKLHTNVSRLLARVRSVTSVQEEERQQIVEAHARKTGKKLATPKLKDYLPYMTPGVKGNIDLPAAPLPTSLAQTSSNDGPKLKDYWSYSTGHKVVPRAPSPVGVPPVTASWQLGDYPSIPAAKPDPSVSMGVRPTPVGSEQTNITPISQVLEGKDMLPSESWKYSQQPTYGGYPSYNQPQQYICDPPLPNRYTKPNLAESPQNYKQPATVPGTQSGFAPAYRTSEYNTTHQQNPQAYNTSYMPNATPEGVGSRSIYSSYRTAYSQIPTNLTSVSSPGTASSFAKETPDPSQQGSYYQNNANYSQYTFSQQPGDWATSSVYSYKNNSVVSSHSIQPAQNPNVSGHSIPQSVPSVQNSGIQASQPSLSYQQTYQTRDNVPTSSGTSHWQSQYQGIPTTGANIEWAGHAVSHWSGQTPISQNVSSAQLGATQVQPATNLTQQWTGTNSPASSVAPQWSGQTQSMPQWAGQVPPTSQQWNGQLPPNSSAASQLWSGQGQQVSSASTPSVATQWAGQSHQPISSTNTQWAGQTQSTSSASQQWAERNQPISSTNAQWAAQTPPTSSTNTQWAGQPQPVSSADAQWAQPSSNVYVQWTGQNQPVSVANSQWMGHIQPTPGVTQQWCGQSQTPSHWAGQAQPDARPPSIDPTTQWAVQDLKPAPSRLADAAYSTPMSVEPVPSDIPLQPVPAGEVSKPPSTTSSPAHSIPDTNTENRDLLTRIPTGTQDLPVLQPMVVSMSEVSLLKEEKEPKDPLSDSTTLQKFVAEVEKFEKFVEGLNRKTLNGPTPLDQKWKEVMDAQEKDSRKLSISVARCYPLKNRFPDIMPYDNNRVAINLLKNDYINASYVKDIMPSCPNMIVTQAPLSTTFVDFWVMVWEQQVEIIVCLLSTAELKGLLYWPQERGQIMTHGVFTLSIQSTKCKQFFTEYMINITHNETRMSRVVVHLQFLAWGQSTVPSTPSQLLQFIQEFHGYHKQQRNLQRPVIVHCSGGVGRSGVFCLLSAVVKDMGRGVSPTDPGHLASRMSQQRKFLLQEKDQLKFSYDAALYHAQDILMKRGILTNKASSFAPSGGSHTRHPSEDFILGGSLKLDPVKVEDTKATDDEVPPAPPGEQIEKAAPSNTELPKSEETPPESNILVDSDVQFQQEVEEIPVETDSQRDQSTTASLASLLDPATFTMDPVASPGKRRITKDSFKNPPGLTQLSGDPLSLLDPMWSLKKN